MLAGRRAPPTCPSAAPPRVGKGRAPDGSSPDPRPWGALSRTPEAGSPLTARRPHHPPGPTHGEWGPCLEVPGSSCWLLARPWGLQRMSPPRTLTDQPQDTTWGPATRPLPWVPCLCQPGWSLPPALSASAKLSDPWTESPGASVAIWAQNPAGPLATSHTHRQTPRQTLVASPMRSTLMAKRCSALGT